MLIASFVAWVGISLIVWGFSGQVLEFLIHKLPVKNLYFYSPVEAFEVRTKLSFVVGILIAFPYIFYRLWRFISPGLFRREKGLAFPLVISSLVLFYVGILFAYWVMMPLVLKFFVTFGTQSLLPLLSVEKYFSFVAKLCFSFGLVFQSPLVVVVLTWMGVISARALLGQWRWVIVIIFCVAAVLTPGPDIISQISMGLPLCILFFASAVASLIIERRRKKGERSEA